MLGTPKGMSESLCPNRVQYSRNRSPHTKKMSLSCTVLLLMNSVLADAKQQGTMAIQTGAMSLCMHSQSIGRPAVIISKCLTA